MSRRHAALLVLVAAAACTKRIPGTDIEDTRDNRAIVAVIDAYRKAFEERNAAAALALVSQDYFDDAGTADASDDLDGVQLARALPETLARLPAVKLELAVTRVEVEGDRASAYMFHDTRYRVATPRGEVAKRDSDLARMTFRREGGVWKIASGL
jgi:ketosteroid isomerase-like protein